MSKKGMAGMECPFEHLMKMKETKLNLASMVHAHTYLSSSDGDTFNISEDFIQSCFTKKI